MPEKCHIFILPGLVHFYAVADRSAQERCLRRSRRACCAKCCSTVIFILTTSWTSPPVWKRPCWPCPPSRSASRRSEEHTSELQSRPHLVCRLLLEKKKKN